jgi:hypothetical protein
MKRLILIVLVLLSGCVVAPYNGYGYDQPYAAPYDAAYPAYGVYQAPAPVYSGPTVYFGGVFGGGGHGGHWGGHGRH